MCRDLVYVLLVSIYGVILFLLDFAFVNIFFKIISLIVVGLFVGIFFTHLPIYVVVILAFLPIKYSGPIYAISFVWMFLI